MPIIFNNTACLLETELGTDFSASYKFTCITETGHFAHHSLDILVLRLSIISKVHFLFQLNIKIQIHCVRKLCYPVNGVNRPRIIKVEIQL